MRALVVGDLMLDEYIFGKAARISPEAPVMVIRQTSTGQLPGGAANVARNLRALGATTTVVGTIGHDVAGMQLADTLDSEGLQCKLVEDRSRPTTRKTRIVANHSHQVLRIDHEDESPVSGDVEAELSEQAANLVAEADVVVLSDYLKGTLTEAVAQAVIWAAKAYGTPVVVNPKPRSLAYYSGATLVSLNRSEASEALALWSQMDPAEAQSAADHIRTNFGFESVLVTLGEYGMAAADEQSSFLVDAVHVEVADPAGAGDTVIATVALGTAAAGFIPEVFQLASRTAACVVQHVGVATPSETDLAAIRSLEG